MLIDEYQDTNHLQYLLASTLAGKWENICVVGDDDQSIYRFRGATIENILSFEEQYENARVVRLEQNYRSTQYILNAANAVISNNRGRKGKRLWTDAGEGEKLRLYTASSESDEAQYVAAQILAGYSAGHRWKDHAVLYRMNAQSNAFEYAFRRNGIPYRVFGGTGSLTARRSRTCSPTSVCSTTPPTTCACGGLSTSPPAGIGGKTVETAVSLAAGEGRSLYDVISHADRYPALARAAGKLSDFVRMLEELRGQVRQTEDLAAFYDHLLETTGYVAALEARHSQENQSRIENVRELRSSIQGYLDNAVEPSLAGFLDEVALYTDLDSADQGDDCVMMMTMHAAKGLEFPSVFVVGMEEGIFPGMRVIGEPEEMEEERRLCYVAMTRGARAALPHLRRPPDDFRPHHQQPPLPLHAGDSGRVHDLQRTVRAGPSARVRRTLDGRRLPLCRAGRGGGRPGPGRRLGSAPPAAAPQAGTGRRRQLHQPRGHREEGGRRCRRAFGQPAGPV